MLFPDNQRMYRAIYTHIEKLWDMNSGKCQSNNLNILSGFACSTLQSKQVKLADVAGNTPFADKEENWARAIDGTSIL